MRILRYVACLNEGSIGRTAEQLGQMIQKRGWESYIAYSRSSYGSTSITYKVDNFISRSWHALITRLFDMCGYGSVLDTLRFVNYIDRIKPEVIHLHTIHNYDLNIRVLFRYLKRSGIPVVWTQHDCWSYTGHCAFYSKVNCSKWKTHCNHCPLTHRYPKSWIIDGSKRNFDYKKRLFRLLPSEQMKIIAVSDFVKNDLSQSFLNKYSISRIYNGIDTAIFYPSQYYSSEIRKKYDFGEQTILMAFATSWSERKGLSDYFRLREIINNDILFVLVGVSNELNKSLPQGIIGINKINDVSELSHLYSTAAIIMNLSSEESFGKTTPEGMACGVPGIVYNCTASPELVDDKTGRVIEKGDIEGVKNAVYEILSWNKEETIKNCRNRVMKLFDMHKNWNQYLDLYEEMAKQKKY